MSVDSMKTIAESIGIASLGDDAAKELADDVTFRLKVIVQDSMKFMHHSKRQKLSITDIDNALKIKNIEVGPYQVTHNYIIGSLVSEYITKTCTACN